MSYNNEVVTKARWSGMMDEVVALKSKICRIEYLLILIASFTYLIFILTVKALYQGNTADWSYIILAMPAFFAQALVLKSILTENKDE